jgi:hypothetical protein
VFEKWSFSSGQMKLITALYHLGQSIWLDNIARDLLDSGTLKRYIDEVISTDKEVLIANDTMRCISQGQHHCQEREYVDAL